MALSLRKILASRLFLFGVMLVLVILSVKTGRESYRKYQLNKEINELRAEIERLEGKNQQLSRLIKDLKQGFYLEKEARRRLNLKKEGERVVILPDSLWTSTEEASAKSELDSTEKKEKNREDMPNYWKWWEYFFKE